MFLGQTQCEENCVHCRSLDKLWGNSSKNVDRSLFISLKVYTYHLFRVKGIVQAKMYSPSSHQNADESSREQIWRNAALHHPPTKDCSAVNGCWISYFKLLLPAEILYSFHNNTYQEKSHLVQIKHSLQAKTNMQVDFDVREHWRKCYYGL